MRKSTKKPHGLYFYLAALVALCFAHAWMTWSFGQWQLAVEKELSESIDKVFKHLVQYQLYTVVTIVFLFLFGLTYTLQYEWLVLTSNSIQLTYMYNCYLVDPASSHMLVSKIKPCMSKYKHLYTVKLRTAHYISNSFFDGFLLHG